MKTEIQKYQDVAIKALAVVGILALLILVSFTTISLARLADKPFSYLMSAAAGLVQVFVPAPHLNLTADSMTVASGKPVTLSWTEKKQPGAYAFNYACLDGFHFETTDATGKTSSISCDSPFALDSKSASLVITPVSTKNHYVDMPVLLTFTQDGADSITDSSTITLTVSNDTIGGVPAVTVPDTTPTPSKPKPSNTTSSGTPTNHTYTYPSGTGSGTYDNPNGTADLAVTIIDTGVLDKFTNAFAPVATSSLSRGSRIAVRFSVQNLGTKSSGTWHFNAVLPTYPPETFNSDTEPSLAPGDKIDFTIGFDQVLSGPQTVKFIVDPQEAVKEVSEDNNTAVLNINLN